MRANLGLTALLFFISTNFGQNGPIDSARIYSAENYQNKFVPGEFIVAFKSGATDFSDQSLSTRIKARSRRNLAMAKKPSTGARIFTNRNLMLMVSEDTTREGSLANLNKLRQDPNVAYVEPNYILHAVTIPNDSSFSLCWGMQNTGQLGGTPHADIDATDAWNRTQGNPNMLIGIIDTGIDYLHPDLAGNIWTNPGEIPNNGIDDDGNGFIDDVHGFNFVNNTGNPMDDNNHGTHVAGTIAAVGNNGKGVAGVMWKAKLVAIKFLDSTGSGTTAAAVNAIAYANAMGITVTNNSWGGGGFSQAMKDVIDAAGTKGDLFVAAAGNSATNNDTAPFYPASYTSSNLISVAATDVNDAMASFSNFGLTGVDLGAPGVNIYSTKPGNSYQYLSGTSMATPHVTGSAALLWSYNPSLTFTQVKAYLLAGVDSVASLKGKVASGGRLNVNKAMILGAPLAIVYKNTTIAAVKKMAISPDTAVSTGGAITNYAMSPSTPLPAGLSLNGTTGVLSGTPTVISTAANDTVVATGPNGTGKTVVTITVTDTAPSIAYRHTTIAAVRNVAIPPDSVLSSGGAVTTYALSLSTPLPAGLTLNTLTGILSGTPTVATVASNDTIIATGPGGTGSTVVNIAVVDTAPAISYKRASITAVRNVSIAPDSVVSSGGAVTSYAVSSFTPLPAGLALNSNTGIISGTPTVVSAAANDTLIATGPGGIGKTVVNIAVADTAPSLSYKQVSIAAVRNVAIVPDSVISNGGAITGYAVVGSLLPAGLILNTTTGILSGIPTAVTTANSDTIMATGPGGTGRTVVNIAVTDTAPKFSYKHASITGIRNVAILPDSAISSGGAIASYAMSSLTPLPAGLTLNSSTGILSGTPAEVAAAQNDTIIATGPGGSGNTVVTIAVEDTAPNISYKHLSIAAVKNVPIAPDTALSTGGGITAYGVSPFTSLPPGIILNSSTGLLSGTPTAVTLAASDTLIATGPGGVGKTVVSIAVADTDPAISYKRLSIAAVKNVSITPDTAISTGGSITMYAMSTSTPLPAGLILNPGTGILSGTPTTVTSAINDTILATGPGGRGIAVVNITVTDTAPAFSYKRISILAIKNLAIIPDTSVSTGGAITTYTVSASTPLPAGLILNSGSGILSGVPATVTSLQNDTLIATGPGGTGRTVVSISVADTAPAVSYKHLSIFAVRNVAIVPDTAVSTGGAVSGYQMSDLTPLPAGLTLNTGSGLISGIPTAPATATNDTVFATGPGGLGKAVVNLTVIDTAPAIFYKHVSIAAVKNVPIDPDTATSTGGAVTSYAMSSNTPLPQGLQLNSGTGLISGIPITITTSANDTILATGPGGTGKATVSITVTDTAPAIQYKRTSIAAIKNVPIIPDTPVSKGGGITNYALSPTTPLPPGLTLDATTGMISGTPTTVTTAANDTLIATGPGGVGKTVVNITVADTTPAIFYRRSSISAIKNVAILPDSPVSIGGAITAYLINSSTPLPAGLSLNTSTGILSGTPTAVSSTKSDTLIATGPGGSGLTVVIFTVTDTAPAISYRHASIAAVKNVAIIPDSAISIGGTVTNYTVSSFTPLPPGLSLNASTGTLFGIPTTPASAASDTLIAVGPGGVGKTIVNISVTDTAPAIFYRHASITAVKNTAITPDSVTSTGGTITGYSMSSSTPLPAGISLNSSTGVLSGTPTTVASATSDTIIATGPGGTGKTVVNIAVADTAPNISYKRSSIAAVKNVAITPDTLLSTGGGITSFMMSTSTPLPNGLTLNASTGVISGTPTAVAAAANDTLLATGPGGIGKAIVSISVGDTAPAFSYKRPVITTVKNVFIVPDSVLSAGGGVTSFAMSSLTPLPVGLTLNIGTGTLSGRPTSVTAAVNDTIIATGPGGTARTAVNITVEDTAPAISYQRLSISGIKGVLIVPDTVISTGGAVTTYTLSSSTPLPPGLALNSNTGVISGTPTGIVPSETDTLLATGPGGLGRTVVNIVVSDTAPNVFYKRTTLLAVKNMVLVPDSVVSTGGGVTSYAMIPSTPLPAGLTLNSSTGVISGTPTSVAVAASDTIVATGPGGIGKAVINIMIADTAPAFSYKHTSIAGIRNTVILPDTAVSTGGGITSYAVGASTPLPAGLTLNTNTGLISGTPTAISSAVNDTLIATGPGGTGRAVVNIAVTDTAPAFFYKRVSISAVKNTVLVPDTTVSTGGGITSYAMSTSTPLPTGLTLDINNGFISGIPQAITAAVNDTVVATGPGGTGKAVVNIAVADTAPAILYKRTSITAVKNVAVAPDSVISRGGNITHYAMSTFTPLPTGLTLNSTTGILSGTPTAISATSNDTIIATGTGGTGKTVVSIAVADTSPAFSYKQTVIIATTNIPVIPDTAISKGGAITTFTMSPFTPLAAGLALNSLSGIISGTPTTAAAAVSDTIIATGPGGTGKTVVNISVNVVVGILDPYVVHAPGLNPFSFRVPAGSTNVRLVVEDLHGRRVWSQEFRVGKDNLVSWNGRNSSGQSVPSGVYLVHLKILNAQHSTVGTWQAGALAP